MKILKRNGQEVLFDSSKIKRAVEKANTSVTEQEQVSKEEVSMIAASIEVKCEAMDRIPSVEEVQDMVEDLLMNFGKKKLAKNYITYRYTRALARKANTTDDQILTLLECSNENIKQENSNKNPVIASTQRDYMAGEVSRDLCKRLLLPPDVVKAHEEGIIHFHDTDYFTQRIFNCCLINLEDMLQNGTVISETMIERPRSFLTACNIATQIVAQVASNQYGGQTISLAHLAPFVDVSRKKIRKQVIEELTGISHTEADITRITEQRVRREIKAGVQEIQYQVITLMTCNGQAPFITVNLYLNEAKNEQEKQDLALCIEELLKQRILGVKNEAGVYITPAFPKLVYVLQEDNIHEGDPYYYLTELAAKCTAKRMVPDYVSEKIMMKLKGDAYPPMGCVSGDEVITYRYKNNIYTESFCRMWLRMKNSFTEQTQPGRILDKYIDLRNVEIYDSKDGWTICKRIIRNENSAMLRLKFSNGRTIECTPDHPFETENRGIVRADALTEEDEIFIDTSCDWCLKDSTLGDINLAWLYGVLLCDFSYQSVLVGSFAESGEEDIIQRVQMLLKDRWCIDSKLVHQQRERKGNYYDVVSVSNNTDNIQKFINHLISFFGGIKKMDRHIPNEVFSWSKEARASFLAGMIDADGYINDRLSMCTVQIGSTNKELAIQQALLAQSLGYQASIYQNHYKGKGRYDSIRYHVSFYPREFLIQYVTSKKKKEKFNFKERQNKSSRTVNRSHLLSKDLLNGLYASYDVTTASEHFTVSGIYSHNCRSFLTLDRFTDAGVGNISNAKNYVEGQHKYYGRFNQGVVTISLPDIALSSGKDVDKFWKIMDERLELCHKALRCRHERLKGTLSDISPIHWQFGGIARLKPGETIDKLLYNGYSTISLGYAGLYECVKYMTGKSHTEEKEFGLSIMQRLNDACAKWKAEENIDYSVYGSPIESTTYKFAKCLQKRFGNIKGITDRGYITNSYHVHVTEEIDAFTKLKFESEFQALSPGGAISYVEVPNMQDNIPAVLQVIRYIYENIMYAELNTKSDYCHVCGYDGEIQIVTDQDGKLVWECPNCGNRDQTKMSVARRTCGYIGTQFWNQGRTQEIKDRVMHL